MAVPPPSVDQSCRASPSRSASRLDNDASSETSSAHSADAPDRRDAETLALATRSEEYRLLFRLPADEVLVQDFNCALQENILLQGHMYLFVHHICFYSNIFGFETKKTITFHEVTCVRKAKTAAIFPTAIEILAGGKKYFFGSFLSRDEAYRLIMEGWSRHSKDANGFFDQQEVKADNVGQVNGFLVLETANEFSESATYDSMISERNMGGNILEECKSSSYCNSEIIMPERGPQFEENTQENLEHLSTENQAWQIEDADAPKTPEYFTLVAEAKFPVSVDEFFTLFMSNRSAEFLENFHARCGDKEFRLAPWRKHDQLGHTRDISFLHPIKIYLGAKFGCCQEVQKFRIYRNRHLVIETSQQVSDVPYADYFKVEGMWHVEQTGDENPGCILRVYTNVAFSKKTMFRGKIEQSTKEECREIYALWINIANDILKQRTNMKLAGTADPSAEMISSNIEVDNSSCMLGELHPPTTTMNPQVMPEGENQIQPNENSIKLNTRNPMFGEFWGSIFAKLGCQRYLLYILIAVLVAIFILMQVSIVVLLSRAPEVRLVTHENYMNAPGYNTENIAWLEKRFNFLKEEILIVESRLERMHHEYALLKLHLQSLEQIRPK